MAEIEDKKRSRKARKGLVTKEINAADRFMAEDNVESVKETLERIKRNFSDFETAHQEFHAILEGEGNEEAIDESEEYFYGVQKSYVQSLRSVKDWLAKVEVKPDVKVAPVRKDEGITRSELIGVLNMPKAKIDPFNGDPLDYYRFITVFDERVDKVSTDSDAKLTRLLQCTEGDAKRAITFCKSIPGGDAYKEARMILKNRFGNDHRISDRIIRNLKNGEPVKNAEQLQHFADDICSSYATLRNMKRLNEVDTQSSIFDISNRLQQYYRNRWKRYVFDYKREHDRYPDFKEFKDFLMREAEEANDPIYGNSSTCKESKYPDTKSKVSNSSSKVSSSTSFATKADHSNKTSECAACGGEQHRLFYCEKFKSMKPYERLQFVKSHKLCENCLQANHETKDCRRQTVCTVPGCGRKHTKFIHVLPRNDSAQASSHQSGSSRAESSAVVNQAEVTDGRVLLPLVKVTVNDLFETCALLDSGSNTTFCSQKLVDSVGIESTPVEYTISTMSSSRESRNGKLVNLELQSSDGLAKVSLRNVYVTDNIPVSQCKLDLTGYAHLTDLPVHDVSSRVDLLIGQDNAELLLPLQTRSGSKGEPFAIQTVLGWSVNGPVVHPSVNKKVISHFINTDQIENNLHDLWKIENEEVARDKSAWSVEDRKVIELWDEQVERVGNHYQLPIPFRDDTDLPNNICVAQSRLKSLRASLDKRGLTEAYSNEIDKLCDKNYAEKVPLYDVNQSSRVWYLPHQVVVSDKKPGKVRIVYDCSSKFHGQSLNDRCLQGPDLANKLLHVLLRFRNHSYAITADIEAMYYQVLVAPSDIDCLRFLWVNEHGTIEHFRMLRHVFGGVWSGCAATYALQRTVSDFGQCDEIIKDTVLNSFYVDDLLVSVSSREQAKCIVEGTCSVLECGGFRLTKFVSNDVDILSQVPTEERAVDVKELKLESQSKVLGLVWNVGEDYFHFDVQFNYDNVTRRVMLSVVSSLYDPLGFVVPVLMVGRVLLQDATRRKLDWDKNIPSDILEKWLQWVSWLRCLSQVKIPRSVKPSAHDSSYLELHHFSDSNDRSYGCCSYLRCVGKSGVHTALLCSKGKVAPIKSVSIPRLELQGAVLAARMDSMLREELHLDLGPSTFWVDSTIVLNFIHNDSRRFQVFVANRVSEIRNLTSPDQWNHISGSENPADLITRGVHPDGLMSGIWLRGPDFLSSYKSEWNHEKFVPSSEFDSVEVKRSQQVVSHVVEVSQHPIDTILSYYSSWRRTKRALAWWLRLKENLLHRKSENCSNLTVSEVRTAEILLIQHVQSEVYGDEISKLSASKCCKSSKLRDLSPFINDQGLLCVGGRLKHASLGTESKHPYIIPHDHIVAKMIVLDCHNVAHLGVEWTLSWVRRKFWITRARSVIKRVRSECITCKRLFDPPGSQAMADLPPERLIAGKPPFSFVGMDCFGPFNVKLGRSEIKRYCCVFTCLNIRAIHIEKIDSMDTDSFLNCHRRFISRRGIPVKIWCDNGSNFIGAQNELARNIDQKKVHSHCTSLEIEWYFHPPHASHWGGIWERMIRTIRKVLVAILDKARLTDEILSTVLCEVESIVNSRPITKVSNDVIDSAPLTPHHLLLLKGSPPPPPGTFHLVDVYRRRWRHVQFLSEQFWRKWLREYLPTLQLKNKWFDKQRNLKEGDLVLVADENTPRGLWPLGVIASVKPGRDGLIRSVSVKTNSTVLVRPVTKIVLLEGV